MICDYTEPVTYPLSTEPPTTELPTTEPPTTEPATPDEPVKTMGDVNGDGEINISDAAYIQLDLAKLL